MSTEGSNYDTVMYVRQDQCQGVAEVTCNDDAVGNAARVEFDAFAGTDYYIFLDGYGNGQGGGFTLSITEGACP